MEQQAEAVDGGGEGLPACPGVPKLWEQRGVPAHPPQVAPVALQVVGVVVVVVVVAGGESGLPLCSQAHTTKTAAAAVVAAVVVVVAGVVGCVAAMLAGAV